MSTPDKSIDPRLIASAKAEFLQHGFLKAELKTICGNAGITTGAVYKRYKGKEALFCAIVQPTVDALNTFVRSRTETDFSGYSDAALYRAWIVDESYMLEIFRVLWAQHDGFVLLIGRAAGTRYERFQHDFVSAMSEAYEHFYREARRRGFAKSDISAAELHVLCSSFWTSVYEPFLHGMTWTEIEHHCKTVCRFFNWTDAIMLKEGSEDHV